MSDHATVNAPIPGLLRLGLPVAHGRVSLADAVLALEARGLDRETARSTVEANALGTPLYQLDDYQAFGALEELRADDDRHLIVVAAGVEHQVNCRAEGEGKPAKVVAADGRVLWLPRSRAGRPAATIAPALELVMGELGVDAATAVSIAIDALTRGWTNTKLALSGRVLDVRSGRGAPEAIVLADLRPRRIGLLRRVLSSR